MEIRTLGPAFPGTRKFLRSFNRDVLLEVCFERSIERILKLIHSNAVSQ